MDKVLLIDARDNVVTALEPLAKGAECAVKSGADTVCFTVRQDVAMGHKLALRSIAKGEAVYKYGAAIGDATADIAAGEHVHSHNLSGYRGLE